MMSRNNEKGTAIIIAAIAVPILLGGLGLVIDRGQAYDLKRRLQKAADAAAISAAQELRRGNTTSYTDSAYAGAALNGTTATDAVISVYNPPKTGKRAGNVNFVEIEIRREAPMYFMRAFYWDAVMVEARATAGILNRDVCVFAIDDDASPALRVAGNAEVNIGDCGVLVNSDAAAAARTIGGATLEAASIDIVGGYSGSGFSPPPLTGVDAEEDPLAELPDPPKGSCTYKTLVKVSSTATLSPGTYCGGIEVAGTGNVTLEEGIYVLAGGGLTVHGGGKIKGDGVMFYNTTSPYAPIWFSGSATAELTAPRTGTYAGILFFQDRTVTDGKTNQIAGTIDSHFTGALYFPTTNLTFTGSVGMDLQETLIVASTMEFQGNVRIQSLDPESIRSPYVSRVALVN